MPKIIINDGVFDTEAIAFVRKLNKKVQPSGATHVVQLKTGYSIDGLGIKTGIFLEKKEGERVLAELLALARTEVSSGRTD